MSRATVSVVAEPAVADAAARSPGNPAAAVAGVAARLCRDGWLAVFGLTVFALGLPLVRVLVPHPEFFIAHGLGRGEVVGYVLVLTVVLPATVATVAWLAGRAHPAMRTVIIAAVAAVAVAGALQPLAGLGLFPVLAVGLGVSLAVSEPRRRAVRQVLGALGVLSIALTLLAVGPSRTGAYVRSGEASVLAVESAGRTAPAVFLVFDELPLTALLRSDLSINRARFPNFARLAAQSDWYRLASSVSAQTTSSVPAMLSGVEPDDQRVPVASAYPSNLFLQLGSTHEVRAYEPVTALCPDSVCRRPADRVGEGRDGEADDGASRRGLGGVVRDSAVVLGHAVGSDDLRSTLPAIDHSWNGFERDAGVATSAGAEVVDFAALGGDATFPSQAQRLLELVTAPSQGERPLAVAGHVLAPHMPYVATPSGHLYQSLPMEGMETHEARLTWPASSPESSRIQGYQRLLLQLGAVDRLLGQVIDRLDEAGVWDEAAVVVTADHGASFEPGAFRELATGGAEVSAVPLFVKRPGQRDGEVRDVAALTIDAVPTLLGALRVDTPSDFDGVDLRRDDVPTRRIEAFHPPGSPATTPDQSLDALRQVVQRRAEWIDPDGDWGAVYRVGRRRELIGSPVSAVSSAGGGGTWSATGVLAAVRAVRVAPPATGPRPVEVFAACDGRFVGVGLDPRPNGDGSWDVQLVADSRRCGRSAMALFTLSDDGVLRQLERAR
jgi:hypothetical protein